MAAWAEGASTADLVIERIRSAIRTTKKLPHDVIDDEELDFALERLESDPPSLRIVVRSGLIYLVNSGIGADNLGHRGSPRFSQNGPGSGRGSKLARDYAALYQQFSTAAGGMAILLDFSLEDDLFQIGKINAQIVGHVRTRDAFELSVSLKKEHKVSRTSDLPDSAKAQLDAAFRGGE